MNPSNTSEKTSFSNLGINPKLLKTIEKRRFNQPTLIQQLAIPVGLADRDIIALSGAGTGRTLAFGIPMIQNIARRKGVGWVVVPFAGLAAHVESILQKVGNEVGLRTVVIKEGLTDVQIQRQLARKPHIVIGQPGRFTHCLDEKLLNADKVKVLVCDEAERLFELRYASLMERLINALPVDRQIMSFFSIPSQPGKAAVIKYTHDPVVIKTSPAEYPTRRSWPRGRGRNPQPQIRSDQPVVKTPSPLDLEFAEFRPAKHYGSLGSSALTNTHKQRPTSTKNDHR